MPQWGPEQNQTFEVAAGDLTAVFADNQKIGVLRNAARVALYIEYPLKGTEDQLEVLVEFHPKSSPNGTYFPLTTVDTGTSEMTVSPAFFTTVAGSFVLPLGAIVRETEVRVSVRAPVPGGGPEAVTLYFETDNKPQGFGGNT